MKNKRIKFARLVLGIVFLATLSLLVFMYPIDKLTEANTTEISAVVSFVEITNTEENVYIKIYIEEYDHPLYISTAVSKQINSGVMKQFSQGQVIHFRIENKLLQEFQETAFGNIVALRTDDSEIFSLSQYNQCIKDAALPGRIIGVVFAFTLLSIIMCSSLQLKHKNG